MPESRKRDYESRATQKAVEKAERIAATPARQLLPGQVQVYQCKWTACDQIFDYQEQLTQHVCSIHAPSSTASKLFIVRNDLEVVMLQ